MLSLTDCRYGYALSLRLCNGEWLSDTVSVVRTCLAISDVLSTNAIHHSIESAVLSSLELVMKPPVSLRPLIAVEVLTDVIVILQERNWILVALSDLYRMLSTTISTKSTAGSGNLKPKTDPKVLAAQKKIYFFLAWARTLQSS